MGEWVKHITINMPKCVRVIFLLRKLHASLWFRIMGIRRVRIREARLQPAGVLTVSFVSGQH